MRLRRGHAHVVLLLLLLLLQQLMSLWVSLLSLLPRPSPLGTDHSGLLLLLEGLLSSSLGPPISQQQSLLLLLQQQQHQQQQQLLLQQLRELPPPDDRSLTGSCLVRGIAALAGGGLPPQGLAASDRPAAAAVPAAAAAPPAVASLPLLPLLIVRCEQQLSLLSRRDIFTLCRALMYLSPLWGGSSSSSSTALETAARAALLSSLASLLLGQQTGEQSNPTARRGSGSQSLPATHGETPEDTSTGPRPCLMQSLYLLQQRGLQQQEHQLQQQQQPSMRGVDRSQSCVGSIDLR